MADLECLIDAAAAGDRQAAAELLPLVYDELRNLAVGLMASERPGHSLDATAVVHEAYLRLVGHQTFEGRRHFFAAAAEAMRRILVEAARRRSAQKRGGELRRVDLNEPIAAPSTDDELLALDEALELLESHDADAARLVKLRYFAGMTHSEAAESLGVSRRVADRLWVVAKTWLFQQIKAN